MEFSLPSLKVSITLGIGASLVTILLGQPASSRASFEFDLTGTLDCGARSDRRCQIPDWDKDPEVGV